MSIPTTTSATSQQPNTHAHPHLYARHTKWPHTTAHASSTHSTFLGHQKKFPPEIGSKNCPGSSNATYIWVLHIQTHTRTHTITTCCTSNVQPPPHLATKKKKKGLYNSPGRWKRYTTSFKATKKIEALQVSTAASSQGKLWICPVLGRHKMQQ